MKYFVVLAAVAAALPQPPPPLTINTPQNVFACTTDLVTWTGGVPPFNLQVQPFANPGGPPSQAFGGIAGPSYPWPITEPAGSEYFLQVQDSSGVTASTAPFIIQDDGSCPSGPPGGGGGGGPGGPGGSGGSGGSGGPRGP